MNTGMQSLAFVQVQGPVSMSKSIGSSNPFGGSGERKSFDNVLAGFLGSVTTVTNADTPENTEESSGMYGTLIESLLNIKSDLISDFEDIRTSLKELPQNLNENLEKEIMQQLNKLNNVESPKEYSMIKEKILQLFTENKILPDRLMKDLLAEFNLIDLSVKEKSEFTKILGKELMSVLKEALQGNVSQSMDKINSLRENVTKSEHPFQGLLKIMENQQNLSADIKNIISDDNPEKVAAVRETKAEVNSQNSQSRQEVRLVLDNAAEKMNVSFQKSLDETIIKMSDTQQLQEKIEPKNLPKFIENQIKNSFKTGEGGYREITVKINPEHLGKLTLKISTAEDSEMTVKIVAESKNIKEFLDTNLTTLRNNLENSGIRTGAFNIEVDFEKNFNQFNGSGQNFSGNSNKNGSEKSGEKQSFEEKIESIFNNSGGLEVFA